MTTGLISSAWKIIGAAGAAAALRGAGKLMAAGAAALAGASWQIGRAHV